MAFRKYREIGEVLSMYKIVYTEQKFVALPDAVVVPQALTDEMDFISTRRFAQSLRSPDLFAPRMPAPYRSSLKNLISYL